MNKEQSIEKLCNTIKATVDNQVFELELKAKGMCVCDNFRSYYSTLRNGVYAMQHQPEQCLNCVNICDALFGSALNTKREVSTTTLNAHYNYRYTQINLGRVRVCTMDGSPVSVTQLLNELEMERKQATDAVRNGRAAKFLEMWKQRLK